MINIRWTAPKPFEVKLIYRIYSHKFKSCPELSESSVLLPDIAHAQIRDTLAPLYIPIPDPTMKSPATTIIIMTGKIIASNSSFLV